MQLLQSSRFSKAVKKLNPNQKKDLDKAIKILIEEPLIGEEKKGDLRGIRVYKFSMINQLTLVAYSFNQDQIILTLITIGSHQNFYEGLKK